MHRGAASPSVPEVPQPARVVLACASSVQQRVRIIDAFRGRAGLHFVERVDDVLRALRARIDAVDVVIVPVLEDGSAVERVVRQVAAQWPRVPLLAYCDAPARCATSIRTLTAAGVHQFVLAGVSDQGAVFRDVLAAARRGCAAEWVLSRLTPHVPPLLHRLVETALTKPERVTNIAALASELGVHRKTLFNWCERAGYLPPAELLAWARLALVAYHLESTGCTVETIALDLAYPSDTALRNTIKRYTGMRASEIRVGGGLSAVVDALVRRTSPAVEKFPLV